MAELTPAWSATGVIEASTKEVTDVFLTVHQGSVGWDNAPLLYTIPGGGRWMRMSAVTLAGGPERFTLHYGSHPGGTVEVDRKRRWFAMQGGYKFRAEWSFAPHERGTLLTYSVFNVTPGAARYRALVRFQFWLSGKLKIGLRGILRRIASTLDCAAYPGC
jgi:hypothetical protein